MLKRSGTGPKNRGTYSEYKIRDWLISKGIPAERVVLSGSAKDQEPHDLKLKLKNGVRGSVKRSRSQKGFKTVARWVGEGAWCLFLDAPGWKKPLVVMDGQLWADLVRSHPEYGRPRGQHYSVMIVDEEGGTSA